MYRNPNELLALEELLEKGDPKMAEIMLEKINRAVSEDFSALVLREEEKYHNRVKEVAARINRDDVRVLLLAGPSGSGKTTTANLIADALRALGEECMVVSLDDFYRNSDDPEYPRLSDGEHDYECPEALRLDEVREAIRAPLNEIVAMVKRTLESTPPELSADIFDFGIVLVGGTAMLPGIDQIIRDRTGIRVIIPNKPRPRDCVCVGMGRMLQSAGGDFSEFVRYKVR